MTDFFAFNSFSIYLAIIIAAISGPVFAITHHITERGIGWAQRKLDRRAEQRRRGKQE